MQNAVSLNSSVFQFGALVGPALSGLLISAVGQGWSFLINAAACLGVVTMLIMLRPGSGPAAPVQRAKGQLMDGLRYIRATSEVAWSIVLVATVGLFGLNMPVILAAFADDEFGTGIAGYSMFNSLIAVGALTGAILSARRTESCAAADAGEHPHRFRGHLGARLAGAVHLAVRRGAGGRRPADPALPDRR